MYSICQNKNILRPIQARKYFASNGHCQMPNDW